MLQSSTFASTPRRFISQVYMFIYMRLDVRQYMPAFIRGCVFVYPIRNLTVTSPNEYITFSESGKKTKQFRKVALAFILNSSHRLFQRLWMWAGYWKVLGSTKKPIKHTDFHSLIHLIFGYLTQDNSSLPSNFDSHWVPYNSDLELK